MYSRAGLDVSGKENDLSKTSLLIFSVLQRRWEMNGARVWSIMLHAGHKLSALRKASPSVGAIAPRGPGPPHSRGF